MRKTISLLLLPLIVLGVSFSLATIVNAQSDEGITPEQEERVRTNCVSIKSTVNQLHASDGLLRVNRGQIYESMATGLMDKFNDRLGSNGLDNKAMVTVTGNYRSALTSFRTDYISYEQKLSQALRVDCSTKPAEFYTLLQEARTLRTKVHEDVQKLHGVINDYRSSVNGFLTNFERVSK